MSAMRGDPAHSQLYAGLLPVELSGEPPPVRPTTLENDPLPNRQPPLRKRASRVLIAFCVGVAATMTLQSYGDAARQIIANYYPRLGWLAPRGALTAQKAPDAITASATSDPDQRRQFDAILHDLDAVMRSLDRIVAGQELITRSIGEIVASVPAGRQHMSTDQAAGTGQEPTTRSTDQTAATGQEQVTRNTDQTAGTGQEQVTRNTDQTAASIAEAPSAKASGITAEGRADETSLQRTMRFNIKPAEAKPPQTLLERGKQLSAASAHDPSCFPSASAVLQNHPGGWPTWTLKAPGHEGAMCWYAAARPRGSDHRPRGSDHRSEMMPKEKETVGTTENELLAPFAQRGRAEGWQSGLP
jgi:hypothetical protein